MKLVIIVLAISSPPENNIPLYKIHVVCTGKPFLFFLPH